MTQRPDVPAARVIQSWEQLVFLVEEPNARGERAWFVRVRLGELPAWRVGPYDSQREASLGFERVCDRLFNGLQALEDVVTGDAGAEFAREA